MKGIVPLVYRLFKKITGAARLPKVYDRGKEMTAGLRSKSSETCGPLGSQRGRPTCVKLRCPLRFGVLCKKKFFFSYLLTKVFLWRQILSALKRPGFDFSRAFVIGNNNSFR